MSAAPSCQTPQRAAWARRLAHGLGYPKRRREPVGCPPGLRGVACWLDTISQEETRCSAREFRRVGTTPVSNQARQLVPIWSQLTLFSDNIQLDREYRARYRHTC